LRIEALAPATARLALPAGTRVLIVEDHPFVALAAEDMVEEVGGVVSGMARTLAEALAAVASGGHDVVLLDLDLEGQSSAPVAEALARCGTPFVVATGFDERRLADYPDVPRLAKPYRPVRLGAALASVLATGTSSSTSSVDSHLG
jgi:CheY-like chemotaxis protein